jgi:hypothetical protein
MEKMYACARVLVEEGGRWVTVKSGAQHYDSHETEHPVHDSYIHQVCMYVCIQTHTQITWKEILKDCGR